MQMIHFVIRKRPVEYIQRKLLSFHLCSIGFSAPKLCASAGFFWLSLNRTWEMKARRPSIKCYLSLPAQWAVNISKNFANGLVHFFLCSIPLLHLADLHTGLSVTPNPPIYIFKVYKANDDSFYECLPFSYIINVIYFTCYSVYFV